MTSYIKDHDVRLVKHWKVLGEKKHEYRIHNKFKDKRFSFKGTGKTEWFRFNWIELLILDVDLTVCEWYARHHLGLKIWFFVSFMLICFEFLSGGFGPYYLIYSVALSVIAILKVL